MKTDRKELIDRIIGSRKQPEDKKDVQITKTENGRYDTR